MSAFRTVTKDVEVSMADMLESQKVLINVVVIQQNDRSY